MLDAKALPLPRTPSHSPIAEPVLNSLRSALGALKARLHARADSEHEQAILRIVIVGVVLAYMAFTYRPAAPANESETLLLLAGLSLDLVFAFTIFAAICIWPAVNRPRRIAGMLSDSGTATFVMFLTAEVGISMIGVYLFITFGNGFRYGRRYLFACQALCLSGFAAVLLLDDYWDAHTVAGWSLMVAMVILPLYVSTLLKRIEEARARAEEASKAKSTFLANMSHEMRTPLNGIVGVVDLLQTTTLDTRQGELVRLLRHSVTLLRSLVDDVLDISKIEAGRLSIEITDFDLHAMLNGLMGLLRPHARDKGLKLSALVDPSIDYHLRGDQHHLRQVLLNLLSNALKFTSKGDVNVSVVLAGETPDGVRLRFEVRDTGIGIGPAAQARIFEQFVQADSSTTRRYGGTGLGTAIAKQLVELMGGAIGVKSTLGEGSTFWFEVPMLKPLAAEAPVAPVATPVSALLVATPDRANRLAPMLEPMCGALEIVGSAPAAIQALTELREQGGARVVIVDADADWAARVFEHASAQPVESPPAMVFVARDTASYFEAQGKLRNVEGVITMMPELTQRLVRNAMHAATSRESGRGQVIDLGTVLREQRQPARILVAEDNATNQAIICQLLESAGHTVILATDGEEALDRYEREAPELAIIDYNMPERNGLDVTRAIRAMEAAGDRLPIILLSASVTPETREKARGAGADEFVGKPYEASALLRVIDRLSRRGTRSQPERARDGEVASVTPLAPIIDAKRLADVERIAGDGDFLARLLRGFRDDVERLLKALDAAVAQGQSAQVMDVTHAIKGAAVGVGASQLAARCEAIDAAAAGGRMAQVQVLATELKRCFDSTTTEFDAYSSRKYRVSL